MPISSITNTPEARQAVVKLVRNVRDVARGKAYGIDEQGQLIGDAVRASFKGKVVDALVRAGIARPGNLLGRIAVGLVGADNFKMITEARTQSESFNRSSLLNAINCLSRSELSGVAGDFDLTRQVKTKIDSDLTLRLTLAQLVTGKRGGAGELLRVHHDLHHVILPQRLAARRRVLEQVANHQPTAAMRGEVADGPLEPSAADDPTRVYPDELRAAARAIRDPRLATGLRELDHEAVAALGLHQVSGRRGAAAGRANAIVAEFNRACHHIRAQEPDNDAAVEAVERFRWDYLATLEAEFHRMDEEDGARVRADGTVATPKRAAGASESDLESIAREPFRAKQPIRPPTFGATAKTASQGVSFGGETLRDFAMGRSVRESGDREFARTAFPGDAPVDTHDIVGRVQSTLEEIAALHEDAHASGNLHQLLDFAQDLQRIVQQPEIAESQKSEARKLAGHPSFAQDIDTIGVVLPILARDKETPASAEALRLVQPVMRHVAETELARAQSILDQPDAPENAQYFRDYEEAFTMEVASGNEAAGGREVQQQPVIDDRTGKALDPRAEALGDARLRARTANRVLEQLQAVESFLAEGKAITDDSEV